MSRPQDRAPGWYRLLLKLLPASLRSEFGRDMEQLFRDRARESEGTLKRLGFYGSAAVDVAGEAGREWGARAVARAGNWKWEGMMDGWIQDLRFGLRSLIKRPGFTMTAVSTLAVGIGANVAIFSVVHGVLLQPLPYPAADALYVISSQHVESGERGNVDHPDIRHWNQTIDGLSVVGFAGTRPTLTGFGDPEALYGTRVTGGLLTLLGEAPILGRDLSEEDDVAGGPAVIVVSHRFWSERLGRDPDVLGRSITLSGTGWEIVGVAPPAVDFPNGSEFWAPRRHELDGCGHGCRILNALGRVAEGTSPEAVVARLDASSEALASEFPDSHTYEVAAIESLLDAQTEDVKAGLWILLAAVGMVLLITCANVANLLLVRGSQRAGDIALRATLGASRARIATQLITESLILSVVAGVLGIALAAVGVDLIVAFAPEGLPRLDSVGLNGPVLLFAAALALAVTGIFGALPALQASKADLTTRLGAGRRSAGTRLSGLSRSGLLSFEVALSLSLLLGAGLLFRTLSEIRTADLGFSTEGVERFRIGIPTSEGVESVIQFQEEFERRLAALSGVRAAGLGFGLPLASGSIGTSVTFLDRPPVPEASQPELDVRPSTPGLLEATGMRLVRGRWFTPRDRRDNAPVAVINQSAARVHYPDSDPIGKQLRADVSWGFDDEPERTIVGIVGDVRTESATAPPVPAVYIPNAQFGANSVYVVLSLDPGVATVLPEARSLLREMDGSLALTLPASMEDVVAEELAGTRFYLSLVGAFSILALLLAAVGLYGVVAYAVSQRTREIGIRIALGARSDDVMGMVLREGARPAVIGLIGGLVASRVWAGLVTSVLYGVEPSDPLVVVSSTAILGLITLIATLAPALRAAKVEPAIALRSE